MNKNIRHCPFCGKHPGDVIGYTRSQNGVSYIGAYIQCGNCGGTMTREVPISEELNVEKVGRDYENVKKEVIHRWNWRQEEHEITEDEYHRSVAGLSDWGEGI